MSIVFKLLGLTLILVVSSNPPTCHLDISQMIVSYETNHTSYELYLKMVVGPVTSNGISLPYIFNGTIISAQLPLLNGSMTVVLKQKWKHENWDYNTTKSCAQLWVNKIVCKWQFLSHGLKLPTIKKHIPITQSFLKTFENIYFVGDSTMKRFNDAFLKRCTMKSDRTFGKLHKNVTHYCNSTQIRYIFQVGDPSESLKHFEANQKDIIIFNLGHTYVWYDKIRFKNVSQNIATILKQKQFPNIIFLKSPAMNTDKWRCTSSKDCGFF
eukprot:243869_1